MHFHPFWEQTFATALPAPRERGATAFGPHASAKPMLLFTGSLRSL